METADRILEALTQLGVTVKAVAPDRLSIEPASKVPPELISRVREAKLEILARLRGRTATKTVKPVECRYDWISGCRGFRLQCIAHKHAGDGNTVFRANFCGRDTLADMMKLGLLTGQALADAQGVN
jgi:hypothetical protein